MKISGTSFRWIPVLTALSVSTFAVGCGSKGESHGTPVGTPGECERNCPPAPGSGEAVPTVAKAADTLGVVQSGLIAENQLRADAGGVKTGANPSTAGLASAATISDPSLTNSTNTNSAANPSLRPLPQDLGSGNGNTGSSGGNGGFGGFGSSDKNSGGGSGNVASVDSGSGTGPNSGMNAAATAAVGKGGGGARSASAGGGAGKSIADMFGSGSGSELSGGSRTDVFGARPGDVNPLGSEDPSDYFTRLGMGDNIFKIVERRYRNQAVSWARNAVDAVSAKSRVP